MSKSEEVKLQNVKRSCKVASKVVSIVFVILLVVNILLLVTSITLLATAPQLNQLIVDNAMEEQIKLSFGSGFQWTSDIASLQKIFDAYPYQYVLAIVGAILSGMVYTVLGSVLLGVIKSLFKDLEMTESPYDPRILKKLRFTFIFTSIALGVVVSAVMGVVCGLLFWCIYTFFSYGCELQKLSDETL